MAIRKKNKSGMTELSNLLKAMKDESEFMTEHINALVEDGISYCCPSRNCNITPKRKLIGLVKTAASDLRDIDDMILSLHDYIGDCIDEETDCAEGEYNDYFSKKQKKKR